MTAPGSRAAALEVLRTGPLATVQDQGRVGLAHLGVPRAGALDGPAAALGNRLVGNPPEAAVLEVTFGGLAVRAHAGRWVAVTGASGPVRIAGRPCAGGRAEFLPAGEVLEVGPPAVGLRSYVAVAGGIEVPPVLGSRSTDTLAWVGPPALTPGAVLPLGDPTGPPAAHEVPRPPPSAGVLRLHPGPRLDWFSSGALDLLCSSPYTVGIDSNRVGLRLEGHRLRRRRPGELPSEGMVSGAVQVPPNGRPVIFLADHPPTGGYPVIAVVERADLWQCAQLRPGQTVRFTRAPAVRRPRAAGLAATP
ncbi:biotin-dependent carboxyltransferase family protein [Nocardioides ferulae]|uniref:5-oxoprolinase subunit C family protein n=1 Tax=Nocardioides ferulae TaxID=2340821 RepID=UPI000EABA1F3|nr:biotin-dependent carboxyltransferase family protein [Nocardioides ferulae]